MVIRISHTSHLLRDGQGRARFDSAVALTRAWGLLPGPGDRADRGVHDHLAKLNLICGLRPRR
jgi:hypothetical protein